MADASVVIANRNNHARVAQFAIHSAARKWLTAMPLAMLLEDEFDHYPDPISLLDPRIRYKEESAIGFMLMSADKTVEKEVAFVPIWLGKAAAERRGVDKGLYCAAMGAMKITVVTIIDHSSSDPGDVHFGAEVTYGTVNVTHGTLTSIPTGRAVVVPGAVQQSLASGTGLRICRFVDDMSDFENRFYCNAELTATRHLDSKLIACPLVPVPHAAVVSKVLEVPDEPYRAQHHPQPAGSPAIMHVIHMWGKEGPEEFAMSTARRLGSQMMGCHVTLVGPDGKCEPTMLFAESGELMCMNQAKLYKVTMKLTPPSWLVDKDMARRDGSVWRRHGTSAVRSKRWCAGRGRRGGGDGLHRRTRRQGRDREGRGGKDKFVRHVGSGGARFVVHARLGDEGIDELLKTLSTKVDSEFEGRVSSKEVRPSRAVGILDGALGQGAVEMVATPKAVGGGVGRVRKAKKRSFQMTLTPRKKRAGSPKAEPAGGASPLPGIGSIFSSVEELAAYGSQVNEDGAENQEMRA